MLFSSDSRLTVYPSQIKAASLNVPGDKSMSHRAVLFGAISEGNTYVKNFLTSGDCLHTVQAMQQLGVPIERLGDKLTIHGVGLRGLKPSAKAIDCGNAGTLVRLLMGILAGQSFDTDLIGDDSLSGRPMDRVIQPLEQMGASFQCQKQAGRLPLTVKGKQPLQAIDYASPIASAQIKSCLLLAGLYAEGTTSVSEPELSRDHTECMLKAFGVEVNQVKGKIQLQSQPLKGCTLEIPGDISSAAFFIVAACLIPGTQLTLKDVGLNPTRTGLLTCLQAMGADIKVLPKEGFEPMGDIVVRTSSLRGIEIPRSLVVSTIDEFPVLFVAAAFAQGKTVLRSARELRVKESDRLQVMADQLAACGVKVELYEDGLCIHGGGFKGGSVRSFGDHRIAMAFAVAGWVGQAPVTIEKAQCIETSFPTFLDCARSLGLQFEIE